MTPDVLVIGAGPAGLAAARAASRVGATVTLLDASDYLGGQYWRHLPASRAALDQSVLHHDWSSFLALRDELEGDPRCDVVTSAHVVAIDGDGVHVLIGDSDGRDRERRVYRAAAVVLATGAFDRALPVPGWDLPGVFTAGGAQALAKSERVAVGERVVVAGTGPFLLPVAASLGQAGSRVVGVFEASPASRLLRHWLARPWEFGATPDKVGELARYAWGQLRGRVPYHVGQAVTAIHGDDRVMSVTVSTLDSSWRPLARGSRTIEVDAVCLGHGFTPRLELAIAAGCRLSAQRFVEVDADQRTSATPYFAAGEITGIGGVDLALAEGAIAGHVAARGRADDLVLRHARHARHALVRFAARIDAAHAIGSNWSTWLTPATIVCRCEDVTFGDLLSVSRQSRATGLRSLKLLSRAGLGPCQGRVCGRSVEALLEVRAPGGHLTGGSTMDRRPISTPVRLGELATWTSPEERRA